MCGVAAIITERSNEAPIAMGAMVRSLAHRGPDSSGVWFQSGCCLGHTRLSVIDPVGGAQPMSDDTGRFHLSFNGEIYNFRDLRRELQQEGVIFATRSDTETLLLSLRQWGEKAVSRLNGQFAFVFWDAHERTLLAARDRLGEKPLYFAETPRGDLLLASEIKALLATGWIEPVIDRRAVQAYLSLNYVPAFLTIYENVHTLRPGELLRWRAGQSERKVYWSPRLATIDIEPAEAAREVRRRLEIAVERQMVADTPVGAFLSGGLDSSAIVALMTRHSSTPPLTFAAGFGDLINELPFARDVAEQYQTNHFERQMHIDVAEQLDRMATVYDEPFGDSSNLPTFLLSEFARRHVKVVLSGDGGDELFGGYDWYTALLRQEAAPESPWDYWSAVVEAKVCSSLGRFGASLRSRGRAARDRYRAMRGKQVHADVWHRHLRQLDVMPSELQSSLCNSRGLADLLADLIPPRELQSMDRAVDFDLRCYLPGDIFVKVDRAAMAHGLETRSPFMDVELVEFVLSLPARVRFENQQLKPLFRRACRDLWPASVQQRSKQGFGAPLAHWLKQPAVQHLAQRLFRADSPLAALIPHAESLPFKNFRRHPQAMWNLVCLGLWLEKNPTCLNRLSSAA